MKMRMNRIVLFVVVGVCVLGFGVADLSAAVIDFDVETDFTGNFTNVDSTAAWNSSEYVTASDSRHNSICYDTDNAVGGSGDVFGVCTIEADFRVDHFQSGGGFWFGDGNASGVDRTNKHWVFFQIDDNDASNNERVRFFTGRNMTNNSGGSGCDDYNEDTTLTVNNWIHLRLDVELVNSGTQVKATLKAYDSQTVFDATTLKFERSCTYTAADSLTETSEVGVHLYNWNDEGYTSDFDNFSVIPEPATLALLGIGGLGVLLRRKRK